MSKNSMYLLGIVLITIGLSAMITRKADQRFDHSIDAGDAISLNVRTSSGNINISNSNSNTLNIDTEVKVRSIVPFEAGRISKSIKRNPPIEQNGNQITIGDMSKYKFGPSFFRSITIDYDIETPYETELELRSSSGNQTVNNITGPITTKASSGNITLSEVSEDIDAELSSGNLIVKEAEGALEINLSSGNVELNDIAGNISSKQSSGNITLQDVASNLDLTVSSGNIILTSDIASNATWNFKASSGDIELDVPDDADFNIDSSVTSGNISFGNFDFRGEESDRKAIGTIGSVGSDTSSSNLNIDTTSGDIRFY